MVIPTMRTAMISRSIANWTRSRARPNLLVVTKSKGVPTTEKSTLDLLTVYRNGKVVAQNGNPDLDLLLSLRF
jgi:hypothetical protein